MTTIHDTIHSEIEISDVAQKIIDHRYFERCNQIMQTGNAYRVFPSATHTRKIHQIGCYHLTLKILRNLQRFHQIDEKTIQLISIGALCHDIGHLCGSHNFDDKVIPKLIEDHIIGSNDEWATHEGRSIVILKEIVKDLEIQYDDSDIEFISNVISPKSPKNKTDWRFQIVSNDVIDADKMDYILRDTRMIGLKSAIDINKIIYHTRIIDNQIHFNVEIEDSIRELLFARYQIHKSLTHENVIKFDLSQKDIVVNGLIYNDIKEIFRTKNIEQMCQLTDAYILHNGDPEFVRCYFDRNTYKFVNCIKTNEKILGFVVKHDEIIVDVKIHICSNENLLENIKFYDKTSMKTVKNTFSVFDRIPNNEYIKYIFTKIHENSRKPRETCVIFSDE